MFSQKEEDNPNAENGGLVVIDDPDNDDLIDQLSQNPLCNDGCRVLMFGFVYADSIAEQEMFFWFGDETYEKWHHPLLHIHLWDENNLPQFNSSHPEIRCVAFNGNTKKLSLVSCLNDNTTANLQSVCGVVVEVDKPTTTIAPPPGEVTTTTTTVPPVTTTKKPTDGSFGHAKNINAQISIKQKASVSIGNGEQMRTYKGRDSNEQS